MLVRKWLFTDSSGQIALVMAGINKSAGVVASAERGIDWRLAKQFHDKLLARVYMGSEAATFRPSSDEPRTIS